MINFDKIEKIHLLYPVKILRRDDLIEDYWGLNPQDLGFNLSRIKHCYISLIVFAIVIDEPISSLSYTLIQETFYLEKKITGQLFKLKIYNSIIKIIIQFENVQRSSFTI